MDGLQNLENAVNIFYKSQSTDQAQLNEYLMAEQKNPLGEIFNSQKFSLIFIFREKIIQF